MKFSSELSNIAKSLSAFIGEVKNPANTATNPFFSSKYCPLNEMLDSVRPILSKHGLSVIQSVGGDGNSIHVTTLLLHSSGEYIESDPMHAKPEKTNAQSAGSATTYLRRYSLQSMLGIFGDVDEDGCAASSSNNPKNDSKGSNQGQTVRTSNHIKQQNKPQNDAKELQCAKCGDVTESKFHTWNNLGWCEKCIRSSVEAAKANKVQQAQQEAK